MKIQRYNEAKNIKEFNPNDIMPNRVEIDTKIDNLRTEIQRSIINVMKTNGDDIVIGDVRIVDPTGDAEDGIYIDTVTADGNITTGDGAEYSITQINNIHDLNWIIENILQNKDQTYIYQKYVIENNPDEIPNIIIQLNARIEKEYPHLGQGKELNLL